MNYKRTKEQNLRLAKTFIKAGIVPFHYLIDEELRLL